MVLYSLQISHSSAINNRLATFLENFKTNGCNLSYLKQIPFDTILTLFFFIPSNHPNTMSILYHFLLLHNNYEIRPES